MSSSAGVCEIFICQEGCGAVRRASRDEICLLYLHVYARPIGIHEGELLQWRRRRSGFGGRFGGSALPHAAKSGGVLLAGYVGHEDALCDEDFLGVHILVVHTAQHAVLVHAHAEPNQKRGEQRREEKTRMRKRNESRRDTKKKFDK